MDSQRVAVRLAVFAALALLALAQTELPKITFASGPTCYLDAMRCDGGDGSPVLPCCNTTFYECRVAGDLGAKYCLPKDDVCYATGSRCRGAEGRPFVDPKPCCDPKAECMPRPSPGPGLENMDDWGEHCVKTCYEDQERCIGETNRTYVTFKPCCNETYVCREGPGGLWGKFCLPPLNATTE